MRGIVRPCRSRLGPELHARWQAHLCGLCLTLRDVVGQPERVLTGYDTLLLSVLVEAQTGQVDTTTAAPCPLRGFAGATVVASSSGAGRLAAAGALVGAAAGLADKVEDGDLPWPLVRPAGRVSHRLTRSGTSLAHSVGLDPTPVLRAAVDAALVEGTAASTLEELLAPTGRAVGSLFAHSSAVAGVPANADALRRCGDAFGRLVHLLDAVEDHETDARSGRFNPLRATGTSAADARALADRLVAQVQASLRAAVLVDDALVAVLLGRELERAVARAFPHEPAACPSHAPAVSPRRQASLPALALTVWALVANGVFVGGSWSGGGWGGRRRRRQAYGGYPAQSYGYRRVGPSCGQLLACNCCANLACNACCCGCANN